MDEGYGHAAKFSGHGGQPALWPIVCCLSNGACPLRAAAPSRERLTNIGGTNAPWQFANACRPLCPHDTPKHSNLPDYFSITLTRELLSALKAGSKQMAEAIKSSWQIGAPIRTVSMAPGRHKLCKGHSWRL